jgi:LPS export ABC transporter protein LptC
MKWFVSIGFVLLVLSCNNSQNAKTTGKSISDYIENDITNPFIIISRGENKVVEAHSMKLYKESNENALLVGNVKAEFFNDEGDYVSVMYSDSAIIHNKTNNLNAHGNVTVVSDSGFVLRTQHILWDNQYKLVTSDDSVMFTTDNRDTLFGVGFESDMDLTHYKVLKPHGITHQNSGK